MADRVEVLCDSLGVPFRSLFGVGDGLICTEEVVCMSLAAFVRLNGLRMMVAIE